MFRAVSVSIFVPGPLRAYCDGASRLELESAADVRDALEQIKRSHPALHGGVRDETGAVRRHVNIFVNHDNIRDREGLETQVAGGDVITILPAVSGG